MANPYRDICARMADELDHYRQLLMDDRREAHALAAEARTLLAQPELEGLTDEELNNIHINLVLPGLDDKSIVVDSAYERCLMRAAIAADRARRPTPQPPADGEVGELVECLRIRAASLSADGASLSQRGDAIYFTRAADLLERFASPACLVIDPGKEALAASIAADLAGPGIIERLPAHMQLIEPAERTVLVAVAEPVAVSERLPGPGDCDELDNCWQWEPDINGHHPLGEWKLLHRDWLSDPDGDATHWLPANALPLPQGHDI